MSSIWHSRCIARIGTQLTVKDWLLWRSLLMVAIADLQVVETDTVGLVGAMPASTDVRQGSVARVPAERNRICVPFR